MVVQSVFVVLAIVLLVTSTSIEANAASKYFASTSVEANAASNSSLPCSTQDGAAIRAFQQSLGVGFIQGWPANGGVCECSWSGVLCNASSGRITGLQIVIQSTARIDHPVDTVSLTHLCMLSELEALNLTFDTAQSIRFIIPSCLFCSLANLVNLSLTAAPSSIQGELPTCDWGAGTKQLSLTDLGLQGGDIPSSICMFKNLTTLSVSGNFMGGIPSCLGELQQLTSLQLYDSGTSHSSPDCVCKLQNLTYLDLGGTGDIPSCVWELQQLTSLRLDLARVTNSNARIVPASLCKLQNLTEISFRGFIGDIPACLGDLQQLTLLGLASGLNTWIITWIIPSSLCNLQNLTDLVLEQFTGDIPSCLWKLQHLTSLQLFFNPAGGVLPDSICKLQNLTTLRLLYYTGSIPSCLWELKQLTSLELISISGSVTLSDSICKLQNLTTLLLNDFTGSIPSCLWELKQLTSLDLTSGSGVTLSDSLCKLPNLMDLSLQGFKGSIPSCLGELHQLTSLTLDGSGITGVLSNSVCNFQNLTSLRLWELTGSIPSCLWELKQLTSLDLSSVPEATLSDSLCKLPKLMDLRLWDFTGSIPSCLWELHQLTSLTLYGSGITGVLSNSVCNLQNLTSLMLSGTAITGDIPTCISSLQKLTELALGVGIGNRIPPSVCSLRLLEYLDLEGDFTGDFLPPCFCHLTRLTTLQFGGSMSATLPACMCSLPQLSRLYVYSGNIDEGCFNSTTNVVLSALTLSSSRIVFPAGAPSQPRIVLNLSNFVNIQYLRLDTPTPDPHFAVSLDALCTLTSLQSLELTNFAIAGGTIPICISHLPNLQDLVLSQASLSPAQLPPFLSNLTSLASLDLSYNKFEGPIPTQWQNLSRLTSLTLSNNGNLSIPHWLFKLPLLYQLGLSDCNLGRKSLQCSNLLQLNGTLSYVDLSNNNLSQDIFHCFANNSFANLRNLTLSGNTFDTYLPGRFPLVNALYLRGCKLRGSVTSDFIDSQLYLQYLDLSDNNLVGDIPLGTKKGSPSPLVSVNLSNNRFKGVAASGNLPLLQTFSVSQNNLSGNLSLLLARLGGTTPGSLCGPGNLWMNLDFSSNALIGNLPPALGQCSWLQRLYLGGNSRIEGQIPSEFGNLRQLRTLSLTNNHLTGEIPQALSNCTSLVVLDLSQNAFSGNLEASGVSNLSKLRVLVLASNRFYGSIPAWIGNFFDLQVIDLSNNSFSGTVPQHLLLPAFLTSTGVKFQGGSLYDDSIQLTTKGNELIYTSNLALMVALDLSYNNLTGIIPSRLTELYGMVSLSLAGNQFVGPIPVNLSNLTNLQSLDLSYNLLKGPIPKEFINLNALEYFNVSYNPHLYGIIPSEGHFLTFSKDCYLGDEGLCGPPILQNCSLQGPISPPLPKTREFELSPFQHFVDEWISIPAIYVGAPTTFILTLLIIRICNPSLMFPDDP